MNKNAGGGYKKYVKRNAKLYAFYFVLFLPVIIILRRWNTMSFGVLVVDVIRRLFFGSTFVASWYITASIIAITILILIPKSCNYTLFFISLFIYLLCCLSSNYYFALDSDSAVIRALDTYNDVIFNAYNSFPVAFVWMTIGKIFAENDIKIPKHVRRFGIVICFVLLYGEHWLVNSNKWVNASDCYIMLVPLCIFIFSELVMINDFKICCALELRKMSTIIFAFHGTMARIVEKGLKYVGLSKPFIVLVLTLTITFMMCFIILNFEKKKGFKWLKYGY